MAQPSKSGIDTKAAAKAAVAKKPVVTAPARTAPPPLFRIESVERRAHHLKMLIYGVAGVGKTTFACSSTQVPQMSNVLMINAEGGHLSVATDDFPHLDMIPVKTFKQLGQIQNFLDQHCRARDAEDVAKLRKIQAVAFGVPEESIDEPITYNTIVIDSLSEIEQLCFNQLLNISDSTRIDEETDTEGWDEYRANGKMIMRLIRKYRDLPMHVIMTSAEKYNQDETKKYKYVPDLSGQLSKKIQGVFDCVGYYVQASKDGAISRRLYVMPSAQGKYDAKHRYASFKGAHFDNPTMETMLTEVGLLSEGGVALKA